MVKIKPATPIRPLPGRGALNDLSKSNRSILDYAKAVPSNPTRPDPMEIMMLGARRPK